MKCLQTATSPQQRPLPSWAKKQQLAPKPNPSRRSRRAAVPRDPHTHTQKIAKVVIDTWYRHFGGSSFEIPLGTVAVLALLRQPADFGNRLADWIIDRPAHELPKLYREIWLGHWLNRPDLIDRALRLHDWTWNNDLDPQQLTAIHAVTRTALTNGLLDLTGNDDPYQRSHTDILSPLLTGLRHKADRKHRAEFHTPAAICDLMARLLLTDDMTEPGRFFCEPTIGSGGMFRSLAQHLRETNHNPHDYRWYGNDIDPTAAACAAVNAILWDLGPHVVIGCSNAHTTDDSGLADAVNDARASIETRDEAISTATTLAPFRRARRLLDMLTDEKATT